MKAKEIIDLAVSMAGLPGVPADTGVIFDGNRIKKVMFGVDMEAAEILIAKQLGYDAVITHHPKGGRPMLGLPEVMLNQIERMVKAGVPINKAQKALADRKEQVERAYHVSNYDRALSAAKALGMPFMAIHTPADVIGEQTVQRHLEEGLARLERPTLKDLLQLLEEIPEYKQALTKPKIRVGKEDSYVGRVWVTMAGGTGGGIKVAQAYFEAGVGTLVVMHMPDDVIEAVKKQGIGNVVVAGHMASDSIGINRIIEALENKGVKVTRMSGVVDPS